MNEKVLPYKIRGRWIIPPGIAAIDRPCIKDDEGKRVQKLYGIKSYRIFCDHCENPFVSYNNKRRYCDNCKELFPNDTNYFQYSYTCDTCGKTIKTYRDEPDSRTCSQCNKKYRAFRLFARDGLKCFYCGRTAYKDNITLHAEHVIPRASGGQSRFDNMVTSCSICNLSKNSMDFDDDTLADIRKEVDKRNNAIGVPGHTKVTGIK